MNQDLADWFEGNLGKFDSEPVVGFVEASNVINDPKCNKGPKYNNFWP